MTFSAKVSECSNARSVVMLDHQETKSDETIEQVSREYHKAKSIVPVDVAPNTIEISSPMALL